LEAEEVAADLLSELGSEDRLKILEAIRKEPLKTSHIALKLSSSIQEASRQCGRLEDVGLIEKHEDGKFVLTSLGKITISLAPAFALLGEEREYFNSHDPSYLPTPLLQRISELSSHTRITHLDDALKFQQKVVKDSEKFVWFMYDQPVGHSFRESHTHFPLGVSLRLILPKSTDTEVFRDAKNFMGEKFEIGLVEDMRLVLAMNEKMAAFGLPTLDGRSDYSRGLIGDSVSFVGWCHDLFLHFWERSIKKYPQE
jgi:predicted transcriptional regulator